MATSKRKRRSPSSAGMRSQGSIAGVQAAKPAALESPVEPRVATEAELAVEYSYVRRDLRQLAIITLGLFAVMAVIGLLI